MLPTWERRTSQRLDVSIEVVESSDGAVYFHHTANLSPGGLYLEGTMPHPPGTRVRLHIKLPGDVPPIDVLGEILAPPKGKETGMPVRFVDLSDADRGRIEKFIDQIIGLPFGR